MKKKGLVLVQDIVENRAQHIRMIGLRFAFSMAVKETGHDSFFRQWFPLEEVILEVFGNGAFPTTWLSLDK